MLKKKNNNLKLKMKQIKKLKKIAKMKKIKKKNKKMMIIRVMKPLVMEMTINLMIKIKKMIKYNLK